MLRFLVWSLGILCLFAACEGEHREYVPLLPRQMASAGASGSDGAMAGPGAAVGDRSPVGVALQLGTAQALGAHCQADAECLSGFCIDGVCCRSSCDTLCSRCDGAGTEGECTVAANDPACTLSCPESSECRSYGSGALTANCEAVGLCRTLANCEALNAPVGTSCEQGAGTCDGQGECVVPGKKRLGEACTADPECGEGNCVIGGGGSAICCDAKCAGLCQTCSSSGHCDETPRDDARCANVDCPDDNLCRDYIDDIEVNLCRGFAQCKTTADCTFTELRSGVQCSCGPTGCTLAVGSSCDSAGECASGACETALGGGKVCCAQGCGGAGQSCSSDGMRCQGCDEEGAECQGKESRVCTNGVLALQTCGNGCDVTTGSCLAARPIGAVCDAAAQCQSGVCSTDVTGTLRCCDASCASSGRACGADGSCVCAAGSEAVGGRCLRSAGQACGQEDECASGACVGKVGGGNVCCAQECGAGSFCSPDGSRCVQCDGAGSSCQGTTASRCEDGSLVNTQCGNGCDAATGVCNGLLPNGQACTAGGQCASNTCAADLNGTQRCCTPNCAASGRVCGADGSCVCRGATDVFVNGACRRVEGQACAADTDCRSGACEPTQGGDQVCCSGACNGQICRAAGQGCVACEGNAASCQGNSSRTCVNNAFVTTPCANGCNSSTGQCNNLIARGGTGCSSNAQCAGNGASCQGGRCCEFNCGAAGKICDAAGLCQCPGGAISVGTACLLANGSACDPARPGDCASGRCNRWFSDNDGDLHGDPSRTLSVCGTAGDAAPAGAVASSDDCCDQNGSVFPGQTQLFSVPRGDCPAAAGQDLMVASFDYDCDGRITNTYQDVLNIAGSSPGCRNFSSTVCSQTNGGRFTTWLGTVPPCGQMGVFDGCQYIPAAGICNPVAAGPAVNACR